jgi:PilZ domain
MPRERRKNFRVEWNSAGKIEAQGRTIGSCIVSNFSNGGAKISQVQSALIPDFFILYVSGFDKPRQCRVMWRADEELGVRFTDTPEARQLMKRRARVGAPPAR